MNKKILLFVGGFVLLIAGVTLTLRDWLFLVMVFRGVIGPVLAVTGLVLLTLASLSKAGKIDLAEQVSASIVEEMY